MGRTSGKLWEHHRDLGRHGGFHKDEEEDTVARSFDIDVDVEKRLFAHVW